MGQIGTVDLDAVTGEFLALATCKLQLAQRAQALMATMPSFRPKRLLHEVPSTYTVPQAPRITLDANDEPVINTAS